MQALEMDHSDFQRSNKVTDYKTELRMQAGKRIAPHLFAKYTQAIDELNRKKFSMSNSVSK